MQEPVREWFDYYTDTAAVDSDRVISSYNTNASGVICFESNGDRSITLYLRNPQQYRLDFTYEFTNEYMQSYVESNFGTSFVTFIESADGNTALMVFSEAFLYAVDMGRCTDSNGKVIKDISGNITLTESTSRRSFDKYGLVLSADSKPSRIRSAMFQRNGGQNDPSSRYVLCFYLQNLEDTINYADLHKIYIGSNLWTFETGNYNSITSSSSGLSLTPPSDLKNLNGETTVFPSIDGYTAFYYTTNVYPEGAAGLVSYTIKVVDDAGLYEETTVTTQTEQLSPPVISADNDSSQSPDDETGLYSLVISHPRTTLRYNESTNEFDTVSGLSASPTIVYTIKQGTTLVKTGAGTAPVTVSLSPGSGYSVTAYAYCKGYVDSAEVTNTGIKVTGTSTFYVSSSGNDTSGTGYKGNPFKTISRAFTAITDSRASSDAAITYAIKLLTDISVDDWSTVTGDAYISFSSSGFNLTIEGYGGVKTVTLNSGGRGVLVSSSANSLTLKNIKLTGASVGSSERGAGVKLESGKFVLAGSTTITDEVYIEAAGTTLVSPISLDSSFTGSIKITPGLYATNLAVIEGESGVITSAMCSRVSVTDTTDDDGNVVSYVLVPNSSNSQGLLKRPGLYATFTSSAYTVEVSPSSLTFTVGSDQQINWSIKKDGILVADSSTALAEMTSAVISLYSNGSLVVAEDPRTNGTTPTLTIPTYLPAGNYSVRVEATIGLFTYTQDLAVEVTE